jgi:SAGA-associated factor 73
MGAKRAVQGRSRNYDDLLLDWQRANNPNFVEPVKRESKAEKKEKREREKLEKKRVAEEAAAALGLDPTSSTAKKSGASGSSKKANKKAAAAAAAVRLAGEIGDDVPEDLDHLDSEAEMDELVRVVRIATDKGLIGLPLAAPCDAGSWFVQRRERARCCRDLLLGALGTGNGTGLPGGIGGMGLGIGLAARTANLSHGIGGRLG